MLLSNLAKPVLTSKTLKFYVDQLVDDAFVRPHKLHLVNRHYIHQVVLKPEPYLLLKDRAKIGITRRKLSAFRKWEG